MPKLKNKTPADWGLTGEWKKIPKFRGRYLINREGLVFETKTVLGLESGNFVSQELIGGKLKVKLTRLIRGVGYSQYYWVGKLVLKTFNPRTKINMYPVQRHQNPFDCSLSNMSWALYPYRKGIDFESFHPRGELNAHAVLTDEIVLDLRRRYRDENFNVSQTAHELGVTRSTLQKAIRGTSWRHLPLMENL